MRATDSTVFAEMIPTGNIGSGSRRGIVPSGRRWRPSDAVTTRFVSIPVLSVLPVRYDSWATFFPSAGQREHRGADDDE